ncbi:MAG TPA: SDR family oxidoreductase, partial [Bryobacteraceae bacterium]|nr:SDR family oxidoreductase [Bryobacteraceae bacterium]
QFAELIGARGPNTQVNAACASTTQAVALAEDWIHAGRCRRVIVISADDVTSDDLMEWLGAGFLATGAAATDEDVEKAATPFDRRRHGMIIGMGAAALVIESAGAARERGLHPICEVLGTVTANSAFHGTRLDVEHIGRVMEDLVRQAERRNGVPRAEIARRMVFVSHETYTPARGGSASAEVHALRQVFGEATSGIVIANTKGLTGHAMGAGIEDVVAVKVLETGWVPPVVNFKEVDPELGTLNLSKGGIYPIEYALRLGAGFGSQISLTLTHWLPAHDGVRRSPDALGYTYRIIDSAAWRTWLERMAGHPAAELEIVRRTLRVRDQVPVSKNTATPLEVPTEAPPQPSAVTPAAPPNATPDAPPPAPIPDSVKERVLTLVVEKTGYPPDMLDLDLDLEADLGVDTVKQAEIFATLRELYQIPRDANLKLRDFPTLSHVIRFVKERIPKDVKPVPEEASAPAPPAAAVDSVQEKVLAIAAEKTGYPPDMLDLDLDLEADLGVDTVKQAEMFASIRAAFGIPRDVNLKLRDFPTLRHVIRFAQERRPEAQSPPAPVSEETPKVVLQDRPPVASLDAANGIPRRVPVPNLRPPRESCKPTGVVLGSQSRVIVMPDHGGVADALSERLRASGVQVLRVGDCRNPEALEEQLRSWLSAGSVQGIYWLPALDQEGNLDALDANSWREALQVRLKFLYRAMRILYDQIAPGGTFLVAATRLGGQHGYDEAGAQAPLGGAVTGFVKTYKRERTDALVKALDFEAGSTAPAVAALLVEETLRDPGAVEIGYQAGHRWTVGLAEQPATDGRPGLTLNKDTVFLVTGAAGSIVSAILADLAAASGGTFYLLDVAPEPDPHNPDLQRFRVDREGLKRDLFARIQERGERATPALVEREMASLERAVAARAALDAIAAARGASYYFPVDLTDPEAVETVIREVRGRSGRIDVLLHAAGLERSHLLPDKDPAEFDRVFGVKADGFFHLLHALGDMPLGAVVAFSSVAGRFGNAGQADYSSANDLLCKIISNLRATRPATRGLVIDWTAWSGIGMATRGSIPKMMELAGIDMLPPEAGIPIIRRELTAGRRQGEIVIGQNLGVLLEESDPTGGLDTEAAPPRSPGVMIGKMSGMAVHGGLAIETALDPARQPFLHDHCIEGTPVLPGVMGIEAFAEAALCLLPNWRVAAVEDVEFLAPFKFYRHEPRTLTVKAEIRPQGGELVAECRLLGSRPLPNQSHPQITVHFTGRVRLAKLVSEPAPASAAPPAGAILTAA